MSILFHSGCSKLSNRLTFYSMFLSSVICLKCLLLTLAMQRSASFGRKMVSAPAGPGFTSETLGVIVCGGVVLTTRPSTTNDEWEGCGASLVTQMPEGIKGRPEKEVGGASWGPNAIGCVNYKLPGWKPQPPSCCHAYWARVVPFPPSPRRNICLHGVLPLREP